MTLKQLLETDGVTTLKWIYVNIIQLLGYNRFIVADSTGLAIMQVDEKIKKEIEVGQGLKLVKPRNEFHHGKCISKNEANGTKEIGQRQNGRIESKSGKCSKNTET